MKKSGLHEYLQIVQNRREGTKTIQRVVATIGRMDQIQEKGEIANLVRSLSRFSEKVLLVLSGKSDVRERRHPVHHRIRRQIPGGMSEKLGHADSEDLRG